MCRYIAALEADLVKLLDDILDKNLPEDIAEAAQISAILQALKLLEKDSPQIWDPERLPNLLDYIKDELESAEVYHQKGIDDKDAGFKQIARDELKHADYLLKKVKVMPDETGASPNLQAYTTKYNELLNKFSTN